MALNDETKTMRFLEYLSPSRNVIFTPIFYLQLITLAEVLTTLRAPSLGLGLHSVTLVALLIHGAIDNNIRYRRLYLSLSLAPLMRVLSLSLPLAERPMVEWYFWIGFLVYVGIFITMPIIKIPATRIGINIGKFPQQLLIGLIGVPLGVIEYYILQPEPLVPELTIEAMIVPALVLIIFTGVLEEVMFRGLIQQTAIACFGRFGITFSGLLFAVLHVGYGSVLDVIFVFGAAILFGLITNSTGSLLGVSIAHGLTNIGLLIVFPILIGDMGILEIWELFISWF